MDMEEMKGYETVVGGIKMSTPKPKYTLRVEQTIRVNIELDKRTTQMLTHFLDCATEPDFDPAEYKRHYLNTYDAVCDMVRDLQNLPY